MRNPLQAAAVASAAALLLGAAARVQQVREDRFPARALEETALYLTSGEAVKRLTVGYHALAADVYWIRALQHFGGVRRRLADPAGTLARGEAVPTGYPNLYALLDLTTTLDPYFNIAYRFGAIFLTEPFPSGAGRPDQAIALLEKGRRARPEKWEYLQDIGFVHYWWLQDYVAAAEWFRRASEVPGAPWWLKSLAAVTLAEGGDRQSSRLMWQAIRESAEIEWLRRDAERRLAQLQAHDELDALQAGVDRLSEAGAPPAGWDDVVRGGHLPGVPLDPAGTPYVLEPGGRVRLSPESRLYPLPEEPKRLAPPIS